MSAPLEITPLQAELGKMSTAKLRTRYQEVHGQPSRSSNRLYLIRKILWRLQAIREGGLSERARKRASELANDANLRVGPPVPRRSRSLPAGTQVIVGQVGRPDPNHRLPLPGALITREYKGRMLHVRVLERGFDFEGEIYPSLSAIAKRVTGSHWNGLYFFGLTRRRAGT